MSNMRASWLAITKKRIKLNVTYDMTETAIDRFGYGQMVRFKWETSDVIYI